MEPQFSDHGTHLEVLAAATHLRGEGFIDVLWRARARFGAKPILVVCDDPYSTVSLEDAYRIGTDVAQRLSGQRVAVALRGRRTSEADRFIELVAANRGTEVRFFEDIGMARRWLIGG